MYTLQVWYYHKDNLLDNMYGSLHGFIYGTAKYHIYIKHKTLS